MPDDTSRCLLENLDKLHTTPLGAERVKIDFVKHGVIGIDECEYEFQKHAPESCNRGVGT